MKILVLACCVAASFDSPHTAHTHVSGVETGLGCVGAGMLFMATTLAAVPLKRIPIPARYLVLTIFYSFVLLQDALHKYDPFGTRLRQRPVEG